MGSTAKSGTPLDERKGAPRYWFAYHSKSILFLIITLALLGGYLAFTIPISVFPEVNFPRIVIGIDNGVMPIDQMLVTITRPVEEAVNSVQGLQRVQSSTSRGSAEVDLFFNWNVDMFQTLQLVDSAVGRVRASLPATAEIRSNRLTFAAFPILGYALITQKMPQTRLWEMATYELKPRLNRLDGVSTVVVQGGQQPEFYVVPDPAKLMATSITVTDVLDAVRRTNMVDSPGLLERSHQLYLTLVSGQVRTPEEIASIVVKTTPGGLPVRVGDVAMVTQGVKPLYTVVTANGQPSVLLNINRQPDSNTLRVAQEVHAEVDKIRRELPPGVSLEPFYDQSIIVAESIKSVRDAILLGLLLASIILVVFLRDWGTSLVAGLVIPVTVMVTFIALKVMGQTFDLMTLGGLAAAVGLVIDDAIVVVENIVLHRDAGQGRLEAIESALREITVPLIGSTITPVVVFIPLIAITGVTGVFFRALAVTMSVALLTSLALAVTWTPNLSQYFIRGRQEKETGESDAATGGANAANAEGPHAPESSENESEADNVQRLLAAEEAHLSGFFLRVVNFHERWLRRALERPRILVLFSLALILVSYVCYHFSGSDLLPAMDEGGFVLDYIMPAGSSLSETNRVVGHVEQILRETPEVESTSRRTGLQLGMVSVTEANTGDVLVKLKAKRDRDVEEIMAEVRAKIKHEEPALDLDFIQVLQDMIGDLTSAPEPIQIKLFAQDPKQIEE